MAAKPGSQRWTTAPGLMRAVGAFVLATTGALLGVIALALLLLDIAPFRQAALAFALAEINKSETKIAIGDIEGTWPDRLVIRNLAISDVKGVWLTLESAELGWRPSTLLGGELHIAKLDAKNLSIARGPAGTGTASEPTGFSLPLLPFAIRIDQAKVTHLTLGKALAGLADKSDLAKLDAEARLILTANRLDFTIHAARRDDTPGWIRANILFDSRRQALDMQVAGDDGAAGRPGLIAAFSHFPEAAHTSFAAQARNDNGTLSAMASVNAGAALDVLAKAEGNWNGTLELATSLDASGGLVAREFANLGAPQRVKLAAGIGLDGNDTLTLKDVTVDTGMLRLTGGARLRNAFSSKVHAFDAAGSLTGLDALFHKRGNAALSPLTWRAAGEVNTARGLARLSEAVATTAPGSVRFSGEAGFDGSVKGTGEATVTDAAPLGKLAGRKLAGQLTLKLAPFALAADGSGGGDIVLETLNIDAGNDFLNRIGGGALIAEGSLLLPKGGGIAAPSLTVTPASGAYSFRATVAKGVTGILSGEARFEAADAAALLPGDASGKLNIDAQLSGDSVRPRLSLAAKLAHGSVSGLDADAVSLDAVAARGGTGPLSFRFDGPRGKAALDATLGLPDAGGARLDALKADIFGAKVAGALAISPDGLASGAIKGEHVTLRSFSDFVGMPLDGAGDLSLSANGDGGRQNATLSFSAKRLDVNPGVAVALDHVTLDVALRDLMGKAAVEATLAASSGQAGITHLTHVATGAHGAFDKLALSAEIVGQRESFRPQAFSFATEATLAAGRASALDVGKLRLALGDASFSLARPAHVDLASGIAAKGLAFDMTGTSGAGRLSADFAMTARTARLHADGKSVPLDLAALLMPVDAVDGTASGTADLDTARGTAMLSLQFDKVTVSQGLEGERPAFNATLDGKWAKGRFDMEARAQGVSTRPFDLVASLPVTRNPNGAWPILAGRGAVSGQLTWEGPIASLAALADIGNQQITGAAQVSLTAGGDVSAPLIDGSASITGGTYENFDSGTVLKKLSLRLEGSRSQNLHFALDASDGEKSKVSADGSISLAKGQFPAVSIDAKFANAHLVRRSDADVSVNGALQLLGPRFPPEADAPLTLKGDLTTTNAQIRIPESLAASIPEIDVIEVNGVPSREARTDAGPELPLQLEIGIKIGKPARISGRGLDSLWTGDFQIAGPAAEPTVTGTLTSVRGALDFAGKTFTLSKGSVRFLGETPIDPNLDIALDYKRSDLAATVKVTGQSSSPTIDLSSTPDLPRDELLSRILFNKGVGELSATQGVQLANTLAQLSGSGFGVSGTGILDRVQQSLGLDVLRIDSAQSGTTTLSAGKYVEKDVYIGVEQGALASDSSVKVEITVTPQISVDTRLGQNASGDVGINWKWDY